MSARVFIFGAGYSAQAFAGEIAGEVGFIGGTTRSEEKAGTLIGKGIQPFVYTGDGLSEDILEALRATTHLLVSIAPGASGDPVLTDLQAAGSKVMPTLQWAAYLSTVGVYGDHDGAWVDEESQCRPTSRRSKWRLDAERAWAAFSQETKTPVAIL
ncbi:NAD(P)-dependent oxidoreductase, partial [Lutimaribacter sp. EGI FJ00014]|nr:NAD(P)-dependent oxidoreductase [Lutimaribacter sp. EGI FJ00014]